MPTPGVRAIGMSAMLFAAPSCSMSVAAGAKAPLLASVAAAICVAADGCRRSTWTHVGIVKGAAVFVLLSTSLPTFAIVPRKIMWDLQIRSGGDSVTRVADTGGRLRQHAERRHRH